MILADTKNDNFTRFIYDALTPVQKLLLEKKKNSGTFWHLVTSNKVLSLFHCMVRYGSARYGTARFGLRFHCSLVPL